MIKVSSKMKTHKSFAAQIQSVGKNDESIDFDNFSDVGFEEDTYEKISNPSVQENYR